MSNQQNSPTRTYQALTAYGSSAACLLSLYMVAMNHFLGGFDWEIFKIGLAQILGVSAVPAVIVKFTKISKWYSSVLFGSIVGIVAAVIVVNVVIRI